MGLHQSHTAHGFPRCGKTPGPTGKQCKNMSLDGKAARFKGLGKNKSSINPSISSRRRQCCLWHVQREIWGKEHVFMHWAKHLAHFFPQLLFQMPINMEESPNLHSPYPTQRLPFITALYFTLQPWAMVHQNPATMTGPLAPPFVTPKRWWQKNTVQCLQPMINLQL